MTERSTLPAARPAAPAAATTLEPRSRLVISLLLVSAFVVILNETIMSVALPDLMRDFDVEAHRVARPWQIGPNVGTARIDVQGDTAWWVHRTLADAGTVVDGVFETPYATLGPLASWVLRQNGRAVPLEPSELRDEVRDALVLLRELTRLGVEPLLLLGGE